MTPIRRRGRALCRLLPLAAGLATAAVAVLVGASSASAHVHVDASGATRGGYGVLTFRVPTESDTASTTAVAVTLPKDTPIASVSVRPVPGWTASVTTARLATPIRTDDGEVSEYVSRVAWRADDAAAAIAPGEYQDFAVSAGPLPDVAVLDLPTLQTYSDGSTVDWDEIASGGAEAEHPAPQVTLAAGAGPSSSPSASAAAQAAAPAGDQTALAVAIVAAVLGAVALVVALIGLLRAERSRPREP